MQPTVCNILCALDNIGCSGYFYYVLCTVFLDVCFCTVDVYENSTPSVTEEKSSSPPSECQLVKRPRIGRTYTNHFKHVNVTHCSYIPMHKPTWHIACSELDTVWQWVSLAAILSNCQLQYCNKKSPAPKIAFPPQKTWTLTVAVKLWAGHMKKRTRSFVTF